jgi:hypothetical protein
MTGGGSIQTAPGLEGQHHLVEAALFAMGYDRCHATAPRGLIAARI